MTEVIGNGRACTTNPLKLSPALGGSLAFLGIDRCLPLLHGSQGCTAFALVLMVRHFREAIPLQTTAMSEISTKPPSGMRDSMCFASAACRAAAASTSSSACVGTTVTRLFAPGW